MKTIMIENGVPIVKTSTKKGMGCICIRVHGHPECHSLARVHNTISFSSVYKLEKKWGENWLWCDWCKMRTYRDALVIHNAELILTGGL